MADLIRVPRERMPAIWPLVAGRIRSAVLRTDLSHTVDIERDLLEGDGVLWLACTGTTIDAAAATLLVRTDRHLVCIITALGGANMGRWLDLLPGIEEWAKAEGAALVRVYGRVGWQRMLNDYKPTAVVLEKGLQ